MYTLCRWRSFHSFRFFAVCTYLSVAQWFRVTHEMVGKHFTIMVKDTMWYMYNNNLPKFMTRCHQCVDVHVVGTMFPSSCSSSSSSSSSSASSFFANSSSFSFSSSSSSGVPMLQPLARSGTQSTSPAVAVTSSCQVVRSYLRMKTYSVRTAMRRRWPRSATSVTSLLLEWDLSLAFPLSLSSWET